MDFLKRNIFWMLLAAGAVVLLVFYGFNVPALEKKNKVLQSEVSSTYDRMGRWDQRRAKKDLPTRAEIGLWEKRRDQYKQKIKDIQNWYIEREKDFDTKFFDDARVEEGETIPSLSIYKEVYEGHVKKLMEEYEAAFQADAVSKGAFSLYEWGAQTPSREEVKNSQKEYWLYKDFLEILSRSDGHGISSLRKLTFGLTPERGSRAAGGMTAESMTMARPGAARPEMGFPSASGAEGATKREKVKDRSGYFWEIPFELELVMDARKVTPLLESLLSGKQLVKVESVNLERAVPLEQMDKPVPEVLVKISGDVLDFIAENIAEMPTKKPKK